MEEEEVLEWSEIDNPPNIEPFLGNVGVCVAPNNSEDIMDIVGLFIGDDLLSTMVEETNRDHTQNESRIKKMKKSIKWKPVNLVEMKKICRINFAYGTSSKRYKR